jgi:hypothetical protein
MRRIIVMSQMKNPAMRRYVMRIGIFTAAYLVTLTVAVRFVGQGQVDGPLAYLVALLPGLSVAGFFWAIGRLLIEQDDEYQKMLLVRQSLIATGFTLTIVTIWGFLENFKLVQHVDAFYVAVLWFFGLGVGSLVNRLTLGGGTDQ